MYVARDGSAVGVAAVTAAAAAAAGVHHHIAAGEVLYGHLPRAEGGGDRHPAVLGGKLCFGKNKQI